MIGQTEYVMEHDILWSQSDREVEGGWWRQRTVW